MKLYRPTKGAPPLRTAEGEAFPETGKMIDPANRYYARLIAEGALEPAPDPESEPEPETDKPAAAAASKRESRK